MRLEPPRLLGVRVRVRVRVRGRVSFRLRVRVRIRVSSPARRTRRAADEAASAIWLGLG